MAALRAKAGQEAKHKASPAPRALINPLQLDYSAESHAPSAAPLYPQAALLEIAAKRSALRAKLAAEAERMDPLRRSHLRGVRKRGVEAALSAGLAGRPISVIGSTVFF